MRRTNARWRWTARLAEVALLAAGLAAAAPLAARAAASAGSDPADLYLEVTLNGVRHPQPLHFVRRNDGLWADPATLHALGFALPERPASTAAAQVRSLDTLPGAVWQYDAARQALDLTVPLDLLALPVTALGTDAHDTAPPASASPGVLLNYDVYGARMAGGGQNLTATGEWRVFGWGPGVLSHTQNTRSQTAANGAPWRTDSVRLDTDWTVSFPDREITATVGDAFSGFLNWTRPVRLGGVQAGRNFALQPYRIATPLPQFLGEAALPSTVELYVNGLRQYSAQVPPGPFQLSTTPGISGAGLAQVVVTDAFGRTRTLEFPFYATQQLLARDVSDWSVSAGTVRESYGLKSFDYAPDPVAGATLRRGVSDRFTVETHAEGGAGVGNGGIGGLWLFGQAGVLSASAAGSTQDGRTGAQTALGYRWNNRRFNASAETQRTHGRYRDLAARYGSPPPTVSDRAQAGINTAALGNFGLSYVRLSDAQDTARFGGAFWSRSFGAAWTAHLSANQNLDDRADRSVYLGVSIGLGDRHYASASVQRQAGRTSQVVDLSRPVPGDGGFGWRVQSRTDADADGGLAEAAWITPVGSYALGAARTGGQDYQYASAGGAAVFMGGHAFASRTVTDAFALVSTGTQTGVPVELENRPVGRTDRHGLLLVPRLNAWQRNRLSIDPLGLPPDVQVGSAQAVAVPRDRSGTRVQFDLQSHRGALLVLHDAHGHPLALGSRVHLAGGNEGIVGYGGEVWVANMEAHNTVRVLAPGGACTVRFDDPGPGQAQVRIGPLACMPEPAP